MSTETKEFLWEDINFIGSLLASENIEQPLSHQEIMDKFCEFLTKENLNTKIPMDLYFRKIPYCIETLR